MVLDHIQQRISDKKSEIIDDLVAFKIYVSRIRETKGLKSLLYDHEEYFEKVKICDNIHEADIILSLVIDDYNYIFSDYISEIEMLPMFSDDQVYEYITNQGILNPLDEQFEELKHLNNSIDFIDKSKDNFVDLTLDETKHFGIV